MMQTIDYFRIWHAGQICDGLKRLFVHTSQKDKLITTLSDYFRDVFIGDPMSVDTRM